MKPIRDFGSMLFRVALKAAVLLIIIRQPLIAQSFKVFAVSDLERVFEDGYKLPASGDTLKLFGLKGETISGQFVVWPAAGLSNVTVEPGVIKKATGTPFPEDAVKWNFVGSIMLKANASNQPKNAVTRQAPSRFPDYLMDDRQIDIKSGTCQGVWLTLKIPEKAQEGTYSGNVLIKSGLSTGSLPLVLVIYPLTLPSERHLKVTEWYSTEKFSRFHGINERYSPEWYGMLKKYAENMAEHRQNVFEVPMSSIDITRSETGRLEFNFSQFDKIAEIFWNTNRMDYLETGELARFGEGGFSSNKILIRDFQIRDSSGKLITVPGDEVVPFLLPAFESHLRARGWLDKTLFHIKDEPSHHNALEWINMSKYIHKYAPDLKRIDAVCTSFLFGNIEIAVPKLDHFDAGYELYSGEQKKGNELWFYTVGIYQGSMYPNKTIDMPLADSRILHWLNYKYDLMGYLHWGWNQWTDDPFNDTGIHLGDAWHVYPSKYGLMNSIRWEQMRNGIQDYECFRMLEDRISCLKDSLGSGFSWIDPKQRSKEIAGQVVKGVKDHSDDPQLIYKARMDLIGELLDFDISPRIYVQTSPAENGTLINRSVVELLGWAEPGTVIHVNGAPLPVADNGLFMERYILYVGDKLEIRAKKGNAEKVITRIYNTTY